MYKPDHKIIHSLKEGKKEAFESIFKTYYSDLHSYAQNFVGDDDVAKDIVQDVFTNLWEKRCEIEKFDFVNVYLFRSVRNRSLNHIERLKVKEKYKMRTTINQYSENIYFLNSLGYETESLIKKELSEKIDVTIQALPEKCREVFELSRSEGLKNREVAERLNISVKTVEKHISIALSRLKIALKDYLPSFLFFWFFCQ